MACAAGAAAAGTEAGSALPSRGVFHCRGGAWPDARACTPPPSPGTQLRAALEEPGGKLPGFMRMCDCLVRR